MSESKEEVKEDQNQEESLPKPKVVQYCDLCHFPVEYCEYTHELLLKKEVTEGGKQNEEKNIYIDVGCCMLWHCQRPE